MELLDMSCCGLFELENLGENARWTDPEESYDYTTQLYVQEPRRSRAEALRACKAELRDKLNDIHPRGRVVLATTVTGMSIAQEALKSLRFTVVRRFRNGNSGNRVTLWQKYVR